MVKNTNGGNKSKKFARKHLNEPERKLRYKSKKEADEQYGFVIKMCGGDICHVLCEDGNKRICVIRKKFRGRGKRDNELSPYVIVLIGVRSWEVRVDGKLQKSDLLHVYSHSEKEKLINESNISYSFIESCENYNEYKIDTKKTTNILDNEKETIELEFNNKWNKNDDALYIEEI
jgi:hypothetical protein